MTLSCADLRWNELIGVISKLNSLNLSDNDINNMFYQKRCDTLNKNPVLVIYSEGVVNYFGSQNITMHL